MLLDVVVVVPCPDVFGVSVWCLSSYCWTELNKQTKTNYDVLLFKNITYLIHTHEIDTYISFLLKQAGVFE